MNVSAIFFYLFSAVAIASAVMVIGARNPVHSVLFLILAFVNAAGLFVLLVAMVGAIVLTLRHRVGIKRQSAAEQVARTPATAIEVRKVESGKGI